MSKTNENNMAQIITPDQSRNHPPSVGSRNGRFSSSNTKAGVQQTICMIAIDPLKNGSPRAPKISPPVVTDTIKPPAAHLASGCFQAKMSPTAKIDTKNLIHNWTQSGVAANPSASNTSSAPCPFAYSVSPNATMLQRANSPTEIQIKVDLFCNSQPSFLFSYTVM